MGRRDQERLEGQRGAGQPSGKRELIVSKTWLQLTLLVLVVGFFVLGLLAYRTYQSDPPIPARAVDPSGATVFTQDDVSEGQKVFLRHGLMEYGSIFGHGAYLGPDFTADYLRRSSESVRDQLGGDESDSARQETIDQFQVNRYDPATGALELSSEQATSFEELNRHYERFFREPTTRFGLRPEPIDNSEQIRQLTSFFACRAGPPRPAGRATTTPTRTTGPLSRGLATSRARTCSCGPWSP
jgi:nitric oxide reductase subunit B